MACSIAACRGTLLVPQFTICEVRGWDTGNGAELLRGEFYGSLWHSEHSGEAESHLERTEGSCVC